MHECMDEMEKEKMLTPNPLIEGKPKMTPLPHRLIMNYFTYLAYYLVAAEETRRSVCEMAGDDLEIVRKVRHYRLTSPPLPSSSPNPRASPTSNLHSVSVSVSASPQVKGCPHMTAGIEAEEKRQRDEKAHVKVLTLTPILAEVLRCARDGDEAPRHR